MPAIHTYVVEETRLVEVRAENPTHAIQVANVIFADETYASPTGLRQLEQETGIKGSQVSPIHTTKVSIEQTL